MHEPNLVGAFTVLQWGQNMRLQQALHDKEDELDELKREAAIDELPAKAQHGYSAARVVDSIVFPLPTNYDKPDTWAAVPAYVAPMSSHPLVRGFKKVLLLGSLAVVALSPFSVFAYLVTR